MEELILALIELAIVVIFWGFLVAVSVYLALAYRVRFIIGIVLAFVTPPLGGHVVFNMFFFHVVMYLLTTREGFKGLLTGLIIGGALSWFTTRKWK